MKKLLSGLCALALAAGITAACNRTDTDRVGTVPDRTGPSASPGTAKRRCVGRPPSVPTSTLTHPSAS